MYLSGKTTVPRDVLFRELDGEAVLLNLADETYYGLDEVGTRIWQALAESDSIEKAMNQVRVEYDVDDQTLAEDMSELIGELVRRGLLYVDNSV